MKKLLTTAAIATLMTSAAIAATSFEIKSNASGADSLIACHWFPICKEPDFQQKNQMDVLPEFTEELELNSLYACHWFPICKEPDQPVRTA